LKRLITLLLLVAVLSGCGRNGEELDRAMGLRAKLLAAQGVRFDAVITADYGDKHYTFALGCTADSQGDMQFTVLEPETIAGITGTLSKNSGKLTFADQALAFDIMADGQVSPVSGPWVLMKALRSGYLTSCDTEGDMLRLAVDDSYEADALHLDVWLGEQDAPVRGEIFWQGRRILSLEVKNFKIL